jgi:hypothetical protein
MKQIIDLILLLAISIGVICVNPALGIFVLLINLVFATQYWKTLLLLGSESLAPNVGKRIKAGILALGFTAILFLILNEAAPAPQTAALRDLWNADFFPIILAIGFLSSLLMAALITEKRKR